MFTEVKNNEKILWAKTDGATSATGDSNAFIMQHIQKVFINATSVLKTQYLFLIRKQIIEAMIYN